MGYPKALYLDGWSNLGSYRAVKNEAEEAELRAEGFKTLPEFPHPDLPPPVAAVPPVEPLPSEVNAALRAAMAEPRRGPGRPRKVA